MIISPTEFSCVSYRTVWVCEAVASPHINKEVKAGQTPSKSDNIWEDIFSNILIKSCVTFWFYFYSNMQIKINLMNKPDLISLQQTWSSVVLWMLPVFSVVRHLRKYINTRQTKIFFRIIQSSTVIRQHSVHSPSEIVGDQSESACF